MASSPCGWSWATITSTNSTVHSKTTICYSSQLRRRRNTTTSSSCIHFTSTVCKSKSSPRREPIFGDGKTESPNTARYPSWKKTLSGFKISNKRSRWRRIFLASKKVRSIVLLNLVTFIYATNIPVVKEVEAIMDPAAFTAVRFVVSAIPFIPFVWQARGDVQVRSAGIELGFWVSLGYLMQSIGLLTSDAGRASFISMLTVIVVPLLDGMLGTVVPARTWFGALMSVFGVAMLESSGSPPTSGDLLNLLSAVFFGIHMLRTEHISRITEKKKFLPLLGYEVSVIAFFSMLWYFIESWFGGVQESGRSHLTWVTVWDSVVKFPWLPALYTGIFSTGLCLWVEIAAMRDVSASDTAIIYALEPVWGASLAWFLLGERWGTNGWIGAMLVLVGSLTVQLSDSSSPGDRVEVETREKGDSQHFSKEGNGLSSSPVIVSSSKDIPDRLKK